MKDSCHNSACLDHHEDSDDEDEFGRTRKITEKQKVMAEDFKNLLEGKKQLPNITMRNIQKRILSPGKPLPYDSCRAPGGGYNYPKETKFIFHYQIKVANENVVMDDTRKYGKTMELYSGKEFQLDWWESCLSTMFINEVASFVVPPERLFNFPAVNRKLRDYMTDNVKNSTKRSCCAGLALSEHEHHQVSLFGYDDLDDFMKNPKSLEFIFDLIAVELPEENKKDTYIMNGEERKEKALSLKEAGNKQFKNNLFDKAIESYTEAIRLLEQIINLERQGDEPWCEMNQELAKINFNIGQIHFKRKDYLTSIQYLTLAIDRDPCYSKAVYRRAQAYANSLDINEAFKDYKTAQDLNPNLKTVIDQEMTDLEKRYSAYKEKNDQILKNRLKKNFNSD